jgi:RNA polymerase sigma factor (sigma-70 family)
MLMRNMETPKTTHLAGEAAREPRDSNQSQAVLFERIAPRIKRYLLGNVRGAEAEELAQRALLEIERSLRDGTYDPARSFNTWAWLKVRTVLAQWYRECGRRPQSIDTAEEPQDPGERSADERLDATHVLREVRRRLGQETYDAFLLYYEEGLTQEEIGDVLGRDRKTVRLRLREAHGLIRDLLGEE